MAENAAGEIRAAGAVVCRDGARGTETALIHRSRYDDWSFPKGKAAPGEHVLLTAVREVAEETGMRVALGRRLSTTRYRTDGRPKRVDYWAGHPAEVAPFTPNDEVDGLAWLPLAEAAARLSYAHDVAVLEEFAAGPAATTPVILIRHADAIGRKAWRKGGHADDLARPLSAKGQDDAQALGEILRAFPAGRVVSSGAERCVATVRRHAALAGATVEVAPELTVGGGAGGPSGGGAGGPSGGGAGGASGREWLPTDAAQKLVTEVVTGGQPAVICAHRQNMPWLLEQGCQLLGAPVPDGPPLRKGAFWVLQTAGRRLASAERHVPWVDR